MNVNDVSNVENPAIQTANFWREFVQNFVKSRFLGFIYLACGLLLFLRDIV
uniref:DUF624 domain-containing protein n=1 Tax=Helicobacter pylori TaxID=210 RepID=UPI0039842F3D